MSFRIGPDSGVPEQAPIGTFTPRRHQPHAMRAAASGSLLRLARWPVKSTGGEFITHADINRQGVAGDRRYTVVDLDRDPPRHLTAAETPRLLRWKAVDQTLKGPDGRSYLIDDPAASHALSADLDRRVILRPHATAQQYLSGSVLITVEASLRALERELECPIDLRRFRPNLHLRLDSAPFEEHDWQGLVLQVGTATFDLLHPCDRCVIAARDPDNGRKWPQLLRHLGDAHDLLFGIFAAPRADARITLGDPVQLHER